MSETLRPELAALQARLANTQDSIRHEAAAKRHSKGYRTARENLHDLVDSIASEKAARFLQLCDAFDLPVVTLTDTPGFMVGADSERQGAVRKMSRLLVAGASINVPLINVILRKAYGLGAIAMAGGSFVKPIYTAAWPSGEFGAMGLEGAVQLGYRKELDAIDDPAQREARFNELLARLYDLGKATESAAALEIDAVIDPIDTRRVIIQALNAARNDTRQRPKRRNMVDTW